MNLTLSMRNSEQAKIEGQGGNVISRVFVEDVGNLNIRSNKHTPSNL